MSQNNNRDALRPKFIYYGKSRSISGLGFFLGSFGLQGVLVSSLPAKWLWLLFFLLNFGHWQGFTGKNGSLFQLKCVLDYVELHAYQSHVVFAVLLTLSQLRCIPPRNQSAALASTKVIIIEQKFVDLADSQVRVHAHAFEVIYLAH